MGKRERKIRAAYFCFKSPACPKLVLVGATWGREPLRRQFFPILMILSCQHRTCGLYSNILLYHDCLPFGKLLHMGAMLPKNKLTPAANMRAFAGTKIVKMCSNYLFAVS